MRALARQFLAFCLTIALIAGGVPFAHAVPVAAGQDVQMHQHDGHAMHHQMQSEASDSKRDAVPNKTTHKLCKGVNCCSMCTTAYVEPSLRNMNVERVFFAVRYSTHVIAPSQAMTCVDPGIPIL